MAAGAMDRGRCRHWVAISAAAVLTLGSAAALLWFPRPGLRSHFDTPGAEAVASVAPAAAPLVVPTA